MTPKLKLLSNARTLNIAVKTHRFNVSNLSISVHKVWHAVAKRAKESNEVVTAHEVIHRQPLISEVAAAVKAIFSSNILCVAFLFAMYDVGVSRCIVHITSLLYTAFGGICLVRSLMASSVAASVRTYALLVSGCQVLPCGWPGTQQAHTCVPRYSTAATEPSLSADVRHVMRRLYVLSTFRTLQYRQKVTMLSAAG